MWRARVKGRLNVSDSEKEVKLAIELSDEDIDAIYEENKRRVNELEKKAMKDWKKGQKK